MAGMGAVSCAYFMREGQHVPLHILSPHYLTAIPLSDTLRLCIYTLCSKWCGNTTFECAGKQSHRASDYDETHLYELGRRLDQA